MNTKFYLPSIPEEDLEFIINNSIPDNKIIDMEDIYLFMNLITILSRHINN